MVEISRYFEDDWYRKTYSLDEKVNCAKHYLTLGWKLGYNPSDKFNGNKYLEKYEDVKKANICPLIHFERYGEKEGRNIN